MIARILKNNRSSFVILLSLTLSACSPNSMQQMLSSMNVADIISTRPQTFDATVALVKLKNPPLLSSLQVKDGKKTVSADLRATIEAEQTAFIASLAAISPDIKVLYRYKMVINGVALVIPKSVVARLKGLGAIDYIEGEGSFHLPVVREDAPSDNSALDIKDYNSVKFIGADEVHKLQVKGKDGSMVPLDGTGMRVGIIDTGIDYTHAMMLGSGNAADYKSIDPSKPNPAFPNKKVVGGIDLVGTDYNSGSGDEAFHFPIPDSNPIDEFGHGTHVAGTVAGIGDDLNTYSGVAPGADLYAIKVFGKAGSTGDAVVIQALEYSADPTGNCDPNQALDVVNLSLGGSFGSEHILYGEAIKNLTQSGTVVVAAAGNDGPHDYIVGAPGVVTQAFSIAASIDNALQNWQFPAVLFHTPTEGAVPAQAIDSPIAASLSSSKVSGPLVYVGDASADFDAATAAKLKGNVALIDRGVVSFDDKFKRATDAGAIGIVVVNNDAGDPIAMSGTHIYSVPAVMISQAMGTDIKAQLAKGPVTIDFQTTVVFKKPQLIDTITDFSSKGPRSEDGAIKPEISAPGSNVISAGMGTGNQGVQMSGTSMATPHMTGVMTLLKQAHPDLTVVELKTLAMETAKVLSDTNKTQYPVSVQGAGRVQLPQAVAAQALIIPGSVSLGEQNLSGQKTVAGSVRIKNISQNTISLSPTFKARAAGISMQPLSSLRVDAGQTVDVPLQFVLNTKGSTDPVEELDGYLSFTDGAGTTLSVPVLAVIKRIANVQASSLNIASSGDDSAGAAVTLTVKNNGANLGQALVFNLLGVDQRQGAGDDPHYTDTACRIQAAGYRLLPETVNGTTQMMLQVAVKLYQPETTWNPCEISVLIDKDGDGVADQELAGVIAGSLVPSVENSDPSQFGSFLLDAALARSLRKQFEIASQAPNSNATENYTSAVQAVEPMTAYNDSTVAIVEAPVSSLDRRADGTLAIRVVTSDDNNSSTDADSILENSANQWTTVSLEPQSQGYLGMGDSVSVNPGQTQTVTLTKGFGTNKMLVLYPQNANVVSNVVNDAQSQILTGKTQ